MITPTTRNLGKATRAARLVDASIGTSVKDGLVTIIRFTSTRGSYNIERLTPPLTMSDAIAYMINLAKAT